jgi:hypothetical protein
MTLDAMPGKSYEGTVFAINPLIDAAGRSVVIRAQVRNQGTVLRPGMFARVRLLTRELQDTLVVPEQAIVPQGDEWYVYRVVDGKALRTKVDIGQRRDGKTEIVRGLQDGDVVVTAGQLKLRDGVPVQTAVDAAPTAAAGRRRARRQRKRPRLRRRSPDLLSSMLPPEICVKRPVFAWCCPDHPAGGLISPPPVGACYPRIDSRVGVPDNCGRRPKWSIGHQDPRLPRYRGRRGDDVASRSIIDQRAVHTLGTRFAAADVRDRWRGRAAARHHR